MFALSSHTVRVLSRHWIGRLSAYRQHRSDEHREALILEAMRYSGLRLESVLGDSSYWQNVPLARRAAVLLFLVDRGVVVRTLHEGRYVYEATPDAETWVATQPALTTYLHPTLELLAALRREQSQRRGTPDTSSRP